MYVIRSELLFRYVKPHFLSSLYKGQPYYRFRTEEFTAGYDEQVERLLRSARDLQSSVGTLSAEHKRVLSQGRARKVLDVWGTELVCLVPAGRTFNPAVLEIPTAEASLKNPITKESI